MFGGFRREDVLRYIEETDAKYYEESERLRSSLDDAQTAMGELRGQNEKLTEKNAELLERLGAMTLDMDPMRSKKGFRSRRPRSRRRTSARRRLRRRTTA